MIHPTRMNLLLLRERAAAVTNSVAILRARRQALIRRFLDAVQPFVRSRDGIRSDYGRALEELSLARGHEGAGWIEALAANAARPIGVEVAERNVMGLRYRDLVLHGPLERSLAERGYDYTVTTPHLEEAVHGFEKVLASMMEVAAYESRLKVLGEEILGVTRRIRVLEERVLPRLRGRIRTIAQYLAERDRESHYRLKRFKAGRASC
jgi:V/A-type H+-transporting ATPase subunit D